jgi:cytochrome c peroxidase
MRTISALLSRFSPHFSLPKFTMRYQHRRMVFSGILFAVAMLVTMGAIGGQHAEFIPNGTLLRNPNGASETFSTVAGGIDETGPFFQNMGTNGRTCASCHLPGEGMSISAAGVQERFAITRGQDPIFRTVDGSNCNHSVDVSTVPGMLSAYSLLLNRGLIRIPIAVPANADYQVLRVDNQYGCNESNVISMYRRPLPTTNLRFLSTVMFDGRESTPATGTTKISFANYPTSLMNNLLHQSLDATNIHAQGDGTRPTPAEQQEIVNFETSLFTAQTIGNSTGRLDARGANGGPQPLVTQPFFISVNSSVHALLPKSQFELPGGLVTPDDGQFTPAIFNTFGAWAEFPAPSPRAAVARGEAIFNSRAINITGVAGINDDITAGGLVAGGISPLPGTCGTCHDTPNVGNHSFPTPLDIGTGDPSTTNSSVNMGGLDISYLPSITVCKLNTTTIPPSPTSNCKTTTDLGQGLIDGRFDHVGKIKGPILRGLSARAPYFHNGSAQTLLDAVRFYESRFGLVLTPQEESDLVAFLSSL